MSRRAHEVNKVETGRVYTQKSRKIKTKDRICSAEISGMESLVFHLCSTHVLH